MERKKIKGTVSEVNNENKRMIKKRGESQEEVIIK